MKNREIEDYKREFIMFCRSRKLDPKNYQRNLKIFHISRMRTLDNIEKELRDERL